MMIRTIFRPTVCFLFFIAVLSQCREQEFPSLAYPGLETMSVTDISSAGAIFRARISRGGKEPITDHGFIWSLHENPQPNAGEKISLGVMKNSGVFQANIQRSLKADMTYYVKAYIQTQDHIVFGKVVSFKSAGSLPPSIGKLVPAQGTWGDTVVIKGKSFSAIRSNVDVRFGSFEALVISSSDSAIHVVVPRDLDGESVEVSLQVNSRAATGRPTFNLTSPQIDGLDPQLAIFEDTITVIGSGFSSTIADNKVFFNEYAARVVAATRNSLEVIVPPGLNYYENAISVEVHLQTGTAPGKFRLLAPKLSSISPLTGIAGTVVTIKGSNFSPHLGGNDVYFGTTSGKIVGARPGEIKVTVPGGISGDVDLTVSVAGQKVRWSQPFVAN